MSIWQTPECDAWSRDFRYEDYVALHSRYYENNSTTPAKFSQNAYKMICAVFEQEMEDYFNKENI